MQITSPDQLSANIRECLAATGASQATAAAAIGLSANGMSRRMTGEMEFRVSELQALAAFLRVPLEQLLAPADAEVAS